MTDFPEKQLKCFEFELSLHWFLKVKKFAVEFSGKVDVAAKPRLDFILSVCPSICLSVCPSVCLSVTLVIHA